MEKWPGPSPAASIQENASESQRNSIKCLGLLTRKERWGLSARGWLFLVLVGVGTACLGLLRVYPFLAETHRVETDVLVVEGWVHNYAIRAAAEEFKIGYTRVYTTGGPVSGNGGYVNDFQTGASVSADLLQKAGLPRPLIQMVPCRVIHRDRTYSSALALRNWLGENNVIVNRFNVVTEDAHARRTRLLFQKAFGDQVEVGVIAVTNPDYDAKRWWQYSEGVRDVIGETIAYIYARFFFHPKGEVEPAKAAK